MVTDCCCFEGMKNDLLAEFLKITPLLNVSLSHISDGVKIVAFSYFLESFE